jgi:hypothetical protein
VNVDGVDDAGALVCMHGGARSRGLVEGAWRAAGALGIELDVRRTIPGVLTDGVALADAGWSVVTFSRGTWGTLARIHTERDTLAALRGDGIDTVARLIAATVEDHARWSS